MADAPWRCSQCGTVNEPVANACRTCGRWPSLFDLERSTIQADELPTYDEADEFAAQTVEVEVAEPDVYEVEPDLDVPVETVPTDEADEQAKPVWQRLASFIVPIGVVLYIVISAIVGNDGG
ncbi:MAG TPA: hypothetical protein VFU99_04850 [Gaiellaceae bacterium]|nr:hypothetical protein [Gaiellaceae bacterium]